MKAFYLFLGIMYLLFTFYHAKNNNKEISMNVQNQNQVFDKEEKTNPVIQEYAMVNLADTTNFN